MRSLLLLPCCYASTPFQAIFISEKADSNENVEGATKNNDVKAVGSIELNTNIVEDTT